MTLSVPRCRSERVDALGEPLGGDVDQVELAGEVCALDGGALRARLRGVQVGGAHAVGHQRVDLIVHEGDERAHDQAGAGPNQRGDLVDQALAAAGRHEHDRIAARDDLVDRFGLVAAERLVAEDGVQRLGRRAEARGRGLRLDRGRGCRRTGVRPASARRPAATPTSRTRPAGPRSRRAGARRRSPTPHRRRGLRTGCSSAQG